MQRVGQLRQRACAQCQPVVSDLEQAPCDPIADEVNSEQRVALRALAQLVGESAGLTTEKAAAQLVVGLLFEGVKLDLRRRGVRHEVIENHVRFAGAQGFLTNVGGLVTAAVTIPANITGLAVVQCRMIAGIAHLRGHDLDDPRVRNAILATLLGEDSVNSLVKKKKLPAPPMALATAPAHDPQLDVLISSEVAADLITRVAGKRLATTVGRRVPVVGGLVGAGADGYATWKIGRYADRELLPRRRR